MEKWSWRIGFGFGEFYFVVFRADVFFVVGPLVMKMGLIGACLLIWSPFVVLGLLCVKLG